MTKSKSIASSIHKPSDGTITYNYTDGTTETVELDIDYPELPDFSAFDMIAGIDSLTEELEKTYEERIKEGKCVNCGALREMTAHGLKDCETCLM